MNVMRVAVGLLLVLAGPGLVTPWYGRVAVMLFGVLCLLVPAQANPR